MIYDTPDLLNYDEVLKKNKEDAKKLLENTILIKNIKRYEYYN